MQPKLAPSRGAAARWALWPPKTALPSAGRGNCDTVRHLLKCRLGIPIYRAKPALWEESMLRFRCRPLLALCAVAAVLAFAAGDANARAGRGSGLRRRGTPTHSS